MHLSDWGKHAGDAGHLHSHNAEEAMYILEGNARFVIDDREFEAGPGEVVFFPSDSFHGMTKILAAPMRYVTIRTVELNDEPCCCTE
jgi:mannose-6-phosphate isomerase-like protein (cupin superfamily)